MEPQAIIHIPCMGYYFADLVFPFGIVTKVIENPAACPGNFRESFGS